jgi:hypothetical protein
VRGSFIHRLGPIADGANDQRLLAERRRLLLHAAGVGDDDVGRMEMPDEIGIRKRGEKMHLRKFGEALGNDLADNRVRMQRKDDGRVVACADDFGNGFADLAEGDIPRFTAMQRDENHLPAGRRRVARRRVLRAGNATEQDVHTRVARHRDAFGIDAHLAQVAACTLGRCEMDRREHGEQLAMRLFGKRNVGNAAAQPGFDVSDRNTMMEGGEPSGKRRCRITLDEDDVRIGDRRGLPEAADERRRHLVQRQPATVGEDVVGPKTKLVQHTRRFIQVLPGADNGDGVGCASTTNRLDNRAELDCLGPRPHHTCDPHQELAAFEGRGDEPASP